MGWLLLVLVVAVALPLAGMAYQALGAARDRKRFPPPGRLCDVGGRRFHVLVQGTGGPTVVVEAGFGNCSLDWLPIQEEVARFTRVCLYDRSGYGWSEPTASPRTADIVARELHSLLRNARLKPPYVLVGHSLGGLYVRRFCEAHPKEVAGLVLVDARHPDMMSRLGPDADRIEARIRRSLPLARLLVRFGVTRLLTQLEGDDHLPRSRRKLPPEILPSYIARTLRPAYFHSLQAEAAGLARSDDLVRGCPGMGDTPLVVISHESNDIFGRYMTPEFAADAQSVWRELQAELSRLSTRGRLIVAEGSGHHVHLDRPDLVVGAIREVVEAARHRQFHPS